MTPEQVAAVAREAEPLFAAAITVALYTGLRTGEMRALRWRDVDFAGSTLRVIRNLPSGESEDEAPKSGKGRSLPLIDQAARALDDLSRRGHFTGPDDRVFASQVGGMLGVDALRDALYGAMEAAGIDRHAFPAKGGFTFHDLRHSYGTLAAKLGFNVVEIKEWMGHAQISTTQRYMHYSPRQDAARRFSEGVEEISADHRSPEVLAETL
jgi:integrase